jgi:hypothetical protein
MRWHSSGQSCISPSMTFLPGSLIDAIGVVDALGHGGRPKVNHLRRQGKYQFA